MRHLSGRRLKRGPEDEPIGVARENLRWHGLFGRFGDNQGDWWAGLAEVQVPVLAVAAEGDRQDPPKACRKLLEQFGSAQREFLCLGPRSGFSNPFGHVEMLLSKSAQREVWPLLARLAARATPRCLADKAPEARTPRSCAKGPASG